MKLVTDSWDNFEGATEESLCDNSILVDPEDNVGV